ncbi:unnamed protein product [Rhizoctonia solani]|uniref:CHAT domain-containing protein n=1 Tax=Rhizoctonia solani TaxID=456999 RepID=A0A8H3E386_9AGAM|nr:unnamed protein product [Rhizoctonia solani]
MDYHSLLTETRQLAGFEDFLQPIKADALLSAAQHGPIVIINCHKDQCDALIILPEHSQVRHLALLNFTEKMAQRAQSDLEGSLRQKQPRQRGFSVLHKPRSDYSMCRVLESLWHNIVRPVLDCLGYMDGTPQKPLPHITWCPTGPLSFLPLHAAGDYSQPGLRVFEYVISSYTPTLSALLAHTPSLLNPSSRVLAIGQAATPGCNPLPGTIQELALLKTHVQNAGEYMQLTGHQATTTAVLDAMERHDWVHLACHAHQNIKDPAKSGFYLHDGTLDLSAINQRSFKNKGLAFLSACQTATGDDELPDEAIHLASGMLMAGYPSVIATMWSVVDKDAPFVADKVYAQLMKDGSIGGNVNPLFNNTITWVRMDAGQPPKDVIPPRPASTPFPDAPKPHAPRDIPPRPDSSSHPASSSQAQRSQAKTLPVHPVAARSLPEQLPKAEGPVPKPVTGSLAPRPPVVARSPQGQPQPAPVPEPAPKPDTPHPVSVRSEPPQVPRPDVAPPQPVPQHGAPLPAGN